MWVCGLQVPYILIKLNFTPIRSNVSADKLGKVELFFACVMKEGRQ